MLKQEEVDRAVQESIIISQYGDNKGGFSVYSRGFFATTECIKEYLERISFDKTRALSVLASGDQIFNLVHAGVREIDAFDINILQYFVYYLRVALLKNCSYEDFLKFNTNLNNGYYVQELLEVVKQLEKALPEDVYYYYRRVLEYGEKPKGLNNLYWPVAETLANGNNYLTSEEDYMRLRKKLEEAEINLRFGDVYSIGKSLNGRYSIMLLSNIADYLSFGVKKFGIREFRSYINMFSKKLLKNGVLVNYMYGVCSKDSSVIRTTRMEVITPETLGLDNVFKIETSPYNFSHEGYYLVRKR